MKYEVEQFLKWLDKEVEMAKKEEKELRGMGSITNASWRASLAVYKSLYSVKASTYFWLREGKIEGFLEET